MTKRIKRVIALFMAVFVSINVFADGFEVDGFYYYINSDGSTVTVYKSGDADSYSGSVIIPPSVTYNGTTYSVTEIGWKAFFKCTGLTSVTIPNSVTEIRDYAFDGCTGLTSVTIGNSVTTIGYYAFRSCGLTSITIPNSVAEIRGGAFYNCTGFTTINWNAVSCYTGDDDAVFSNCENLETVNIGDNVKVLPHYFVCRSGVKSITIPNNVTTIGYGAFAGSELTTVKIGNGIEEIGCNAFGKHIDTIYCMAKFPPELPTGCYYGYSQSTEQAFHNVNKGINVFVACGSLPNYQTAEYWSEFINIKEDCTIDGFEAGTTPDNAINVVENDNSITVYPNPAKDNITIECDGDVIIINNAGQVVKKFNNVKGTKTISISPI